MHLHESHAYLNRLRRLHPGYKLALATTTSLCCLLLSNPWASLVAILWMGGLTVVAAQAPLRQFLGLLVAEFFFLALSVIGIVVSFSLAAPEQMAWVWHIGPVWVSSGPEPLWQGLVVLMRALGAASAMSFLALTTPLVDLMDVLRRLHVPEFLIDVMTVMYRFVFVLLATLGRIATAQDARLGYVDKRRAMHSAGLLGSQLFVTTFRRSQRMQTALDSRGYNNSLRVLPGEYATSQRWVWLTVCVACSMLMVSMFA